jgi:AcrR family transcriptional regulator
LKTKELIIADALRLASAGGMAAVSFGTLAARLDLSKSGLFAHFKDKTDLELAILDAAEVAFRANVIEPAMKSRAGLPRLRKLFDLWLGWASRCGLGGGCPVLGASFEYDDVPGPVRDRVAGLQRRWMAFLQSVVEDAKAAGDLSASADARQLVSGMFGIYLSHHVAARLLDDPEATAVARRSSSILLAAFAAGAGK